MLTCMHACMQEAYGLAVGDEYTLCVFVGRITHQKGNDIIAAAAPYIMSKHPKIQIISAGPVGDGIGKRPRHSDAARQGVYRCMRWTKCNCICSAQRGTVARAA